MRKDCHSKTIDLRFKYHDNTWTIKSNYLWELIFFNPWIILFFCGVVGLCWAIDFWWRTTINYNIRREKKGGGEEEETQRWSAEEDGIVNQLACEVQM